MKWKVSGEKRKYFVQGRIEQPKEDKNLLYRYDEPKEPTKEKEEPFHVNSLSPYLP